LIEIIETSIFTRQVQALLSEDEYRLLQIALLQNPESGDVIPHSGGLRKKRWSARGKGKRGGSRIIYYWAVSPEQILLLLIYSKNEQDDLTSEQLKMLRMIIKKEYP
jgi:mRNA-degrading endonuclease RelE of RelBE toxin-antitoxin system